jgi:mannan endo-1,6-alpha-mannosidase
MPQNQSFDMGNDDEAFWTFTAMNAAETKFPPPQQSYPTWSTMVDVVFNLQAVRKPTEVAIYHG